MSIGNQLKTIEYYAFRGCTQLKSIILPASLASLGQGVFEDSPNALSGLTQIIIESPSWSLNEEGVFEDNVSLYAYTKPHTGAEQLPTKTYIMDPPDSDPDFVGFSFGGIHCKYDLGVVRTINNRINDNLSATKKDITVEIPGGDGSYYFGSLDRNKVFSVEYAFDRLTEKQLREWK